MNFVKSGLENWILMSQTTSRVSLDDKKIKINWFNLNKIVIGSIQGDQFLYINSQV